MRGTRTTPPSTAPGLTAERDGASTPGRPPSGHGDAADAAACQAIVRRHARTFGLASRLLPPARRRGAYAIYATCRRADDLVDLAPTAEAAASLAAYRREAFDALGRPAARPELRELALTVRRFGVSRDALAELFDGLQRDLSHAPVRDWDHLEAYCQGVAGCVGELTSAVFGIRPGADARRVVHHARTLGVAMQLTNILRDVGEDARRGRCYLPVEELGRYGLEPGEVLAFQLRPRWRAWRAFMAMQVERARGLYREAAQGIPDLEAESIPCAIACAAGYAEILRAIEQRDYDSLTGRATTPPFTRMRVAWSSWRRRTPTFGAPPGSPDGSGRDAVPATD